MGKKTCKSETLARIIIIESLGWRARRRSQQDKLFSWDCVTSYITLCLNPALEKVPTSPHRLGAVDMWYFRPHCAAQVLGCVVTMHVTVLNGSIYPSNRVIRREAIWQIIQKTPRLCLIYRYNQAVFVNASGIMPRVMHFKCQRSLYCFIDNGNSYDLFWVDSKTNTNILKIFAGNYKKGALKCILFVVFVFKGKVRNQA